MWGRGGQGRGGRRGRRREGKTNGGAGEGGSDEGGVEKALACKAAENAAAAPEEKAGTTAVTKKLGKMVGVVGEEEQPRRWHGRRWCWWRWGRRWNVRLWRRGVGCLGWWISWCG